MSDPLSASEAAPRRSSADGRGDGVNDDSVPRKGTWIAIATFGTLLLSLAGMLGARWATDGNLFQLAPLQVVLGSVAFLAAITCIVVVFGRLGLFDRSKPLALPEGSVRALIALVLLIIFVIFANVVFGQLSVSNATTRQFNGLTAAQVGALPGPVVSQTVDQPGGSGSNDDTFKGRFVVPANADAATLGQQIVTALITLVTAISAFYFGSGAVETATRSARSATRGRSGLTILSPSSPTGLTPLEGGAYAPITIRLTGPSLDVGSVSASVNGDSPRTVLADAADAGTFVYTPAAPESDVVITFVATDGAKTELKLAK